MLRQTPTTCDQQHQHATTLRGVDDNGLFRTAPAKQYPRGMCSLLAKLAHGQFWAACRAMPPPPPLLEEFAQSVLAQFYIPTDPYLEVQSFGADLSVHTGTYRSLPLCQIARKRLLMKRLLKQKPTLAKPLPSSALYQKVISVLTSMVLAGSLLWPSFARFYCSWSALP